MKWYQQRNKIKQVASIPLPLVSPIFPTPAHHRKSGRSLGKSNLRPMFKYTSVDMSSTEDTRNFLEAPELMTFVMKSDGKVKI